MNFRNYINGRWVTAKSGKTFENRSPADVTDLIGLFPASDVSDVNAAVEAAKQAFDSWRRTPAPKRGELLFKVGDILTRRKEEIAHAMTREMGKVLKETRGDVQEAIDTAYLHGGEGRRMFGYSAPSELRNKMGWTTRAPIGVCALITPWNFPLAIPTWKSFPALVAGNTIVLKPASFTPHSSQLLFEVLEEAGFPDGVANLVQGSGREVGTPLARHPDVKVVSFTGSSEVGRDMAAFAGRDLKRISLELGGKNAQIVMPDADVDLAMEGTLWGAFGTTGQRCTATSRLIIHRDIHRSYVEKLVERANKLKLGNGLDESVEVGPTVDISRVDAIMPYMEIGAKEGNLLCGGYKPDDSHLRRGSFFKPTIFDNVKPDARIAKEEIFGPVLTVIEVKSLEEAIAVLNDSAYGLSASIYTRDVNKAFAAMQDIDTGIVYVNAPTIGAECHYPFGGTKDTGNGHREGAHTVYEVFTEWKTFYVDYSGQLQKAQINE